MIFAGKIVALFILIGSPLLAHTYPNDWPTAKQEEKAVGESFDSPNKKFCINVLEDPNATFKRDAYIQLLVMPSEKRLASRHLALAHAFSTAWNLDSTLVAINYDLGNASTTMKLFRVSAKGLTEIKLPDSISLAHLLPKNDPLLKAGFHFQSLSAVKWKTNNVVICSVFGSAREVDSREENFSTEDYSTISYELLLRCEDSKAKLISSTFTGKQTNE